MKKAVKSLAVILVVLTLCISLIGCGSGSGVVGKWQLVGGESQGVEVDVTALFGEWIFDFKSNGECEVIMNGTSSGSSKYTVKDGKVECDGLVFEVNGNTMTTVASGATLTFKRV